VEQVLQSVAWRQEFWTEWHSERDIATGDWMVRPRDGLIIVVRLWTDENVGEFSLVAIITT